MKVCSVCGSAWCLAGGGDICVNWRTPRYAKKTLFDALDKREEELL